MQKPIAVWNSARDVWETPGTEGLFCEHLDVYSETWPTSGSTRNGAAYARPTWEHATPDTESSSLLLTPVAPEGIKPSNTMGVARRLTTGQVFLTNQIVSLCGLDPSEPRLLKTPTSQLAVNGGSQHPEKRKAGGHGPTLADEIEHLLPTPTVGMTQGGNKTRSGARSDELLLNGLAEAIAAGSTGENTPKRSPVKSQLWEDVPLPLPSRLGETETSG